MAIKKKQPEVHYYALLDDNEENNVAAEKAITKALRECAEKIQKIDKKYPHVGIGDTATDEEIAGVFYGMIH